MTNTELADEIDKFWKMLVKSSTGEAHDYCQAATISKNAFAETVSGLIKDRHSLNGMATLLAQSRETISIMLMRFSEPALSRNAGHNTDVALADQIERWLADDPDHMGLHSLSEAQWRGIVAALRRQHETNIRRANESLNGPERQPSSDQVLILKSFAKNRCHACGWPLSGSATQGCTPFNCSYRPREESPDHDSWLKRAHEMARVLAAAEAEGRKT